MGRGLSELQRWILQAAASTLNGQLRFDAVLKGFFGWDERRFHGDGGPPGAASNRASLSRAVTRLEKRGLVACRWDPAHHYRHNVEITAAGREWLSANKLAATSHLLADTEGESLEDLARRINDRDGRS
jgi:DNA-binding PadR family transcriptional regulator